MKISIALMISGIAIFLCYMFWLEGKNTEQRNGVDPVASQSQSEQSHTAVNDSPFALDNRSSAMTDSSPIAQSSDIADSSVLSSDDYSSLWGSVLSEHELGVLVEQLEGNPALLAQLMDEFRQELDPERKVRLAMVLGEVGGEQVTLLASELIFSGDSDARVLGMDLLQDIQPGNTQARNIASDMLATEVEPKTLVDAMTALSIPGEVDPASRLFLSDQLALLATHEDESVRSISLDILSRWSDDGRYTGVLLSGLDDASEYVRASAAYALAEHEDQSLAVVSRLFATVRASTETTQVKRAAILALRSMPLTPDQRNELTLLERRLNTIAR